MMYAIHKLGFEPRNIVVFAWSIGGFSGALMARSFPDIKFVVSPQIAAQVAFHRAFLTSL